MKQTGLLIKIDPRDYMVGASPIVQAVVNETADWKNWKPSEERQYKDYAFDTLSCATFAALNVLETTVNFLMANNKLAKSQIDWLNENGYIENGLLNTSDRFTAIMSGTTNLGNTMQKVWDSIRKDGVLPEKDLPFGGNSFDEYHNKDLITDAMKAKAQKFLSIIESSYEWSQIDTPALKASLQQCPLEVAINYSTHAVELIDIENIFDTYVPFLKPIPTPITYALKGIVKAKPVPVKRTLKFGMTGDDVKQLQNDLKELKFFSYYTTTLFFGLVTLSAVKAFQKANGLYVDGIVGKMTFAKIEELKKNPKIDWGLLPEIQTKADLLISRCKNVGYNIRITEGYRSQARQDELYAQGRTKAGKIVTYAKVSKHTSGKAFDIAFIGSNPYPTDDKIWRAIANIAVDCGLTAGYYFEGFQDRTHFEI